MSPRVALPETTAEALRLLGEADDDCKVIAGGTAVMLMMRLGLLAPDQLIALDRLTDLRSIEVADQHVRLGAMTTLEDIERSAQLRQVLPTLASTVALVANHRVRHRATIGGNLSEADYASDPPAVLMTMGCRVEVSSSHGQRWVALDDFLVDYYETALEPDELVTRIGIPVPSPATRTTYLKFVSRSAEDRPCVGVAARLEVDDAGRCTELRIAVAGATSVPFTLADVTAECQGSRLDATAHERIASAYRDAIRPIADARGSQDYRKHLTGELVRRALETVAGQAGNGAWLL